MEPDFLIADDADVIGCCPKINDGMDESNTAGRALLQTRASTGTEAYP
jgi:hypothetical protein